MTGPGGDAVDRTVRLPDGRALGYAEFGDPGGTALVNCHGGLTSRLDIAGCDAAARRVGVRVISPDRPGIGTSDRRPGRSLLDWPRDVGFLVDELGVEQFVVYGWSAGGPYAAACAFVMPERVRAVGLVASTVPRSAMVGDLNRADRLFMLLSTSAPLVDRFAFRAMGGLARRSPAAFHRLSIATLDPPSRAKVVAMPPGEFAEPISVGLANPTGVVDDYRILGSEWGFEPGQIAPHVCIWQGGVDRFVPPVWGEWLASHIPGAELFALPGEGHFLAMDRYEELFSRLLLEG